MEEWGSAWQERRILSAIHLFGGPLMDHEPEHAMPKEIYTALELIADQLANPTASGQTKHNWEGTGQERTRRRTARQRGSPWLGTRPYPPKRPFVRTGGESYVPQASSCGPFFACHYERIGPK